jgi:predicted nucleotidyltransferase
LPTSSNEPDRFAGDLLPHSVAVEVFGIHCPVLGLRKLIEVKRAAGRPKDLEAIAELERLLENTDT